MGTQTNSSDIKVENIPKEDIFQNEGKGISDERTENTTSLSVCVDEKKNKKISRVTLQEDKETTPDNFKTDGDTFTTSGPALDKEDQMASSIPSIHMKSSTEDGIIGSSSQSIHVKTDRDDDIIGFDIRHEEEKERQRLADEALWKPAPAPFELPKSEVKKMETKVVSRPETPKVIDMAEPTMTPEQKEKRGNFIKDWQRDLKEFFSLGKSKKNEKSMRSHKSSLSSKSSSMTLERADSRTFGEKKTNVSEIPNRSEQNESKEEPRNDSNETPVKVETTESNDKMQEEQKQLEEAGGVEETEKKDDGNKETVSVRRSKRDRKSRRKTNSESSTPRHSIPSSPGEEEKKIGHVGETEQQVENVGIGSHIQGSKEEEQVQEMRKVCHMKETRTVSQVEETRRVTQVEEVRKVSQGEESNNQVTYRRDESSILAIGGKPKVVVPSPKGIPKPVPKPKNRDSLISQDSFDEETLPLSPGAALQLSKVAAETETLSLSRKNTSEKNTRSDSGPQQNNQENEEFKKAVDSFDRLYQEEGEGETNNNSSKKKRNRKKHGSKNHSFDFETEDTKEEAMEREQQSKVNDLKKLEEDPRWSFESEGTHDEVLQWEQAYSSKQSEEENGGGVAVEVTKKNNQKKNSKKKRGRHGQGQGQGETINVQHTEASTDHRIQQSFPIGSEPTSTLCSAEQSLTEENTQFSEAQKNLIEERALFSEAQKNLMEKDAKLFEAQKNLMEKDAELFEVQKNLMDESAQFSGATTNIIEESAQFSAAQNNKMEQNTQYSEEQNNLMEENAQFSEAQKNIMRKAKETQDAIQSSLIDIEMGKMEEVVRVQKHSLGVQDGVMGERKPTIKMIRQSQEFGSDDEEDFQIDPESLKNVDGQPRVRKGSSRVAKHQSNKGKSPRTSISAVEDEDNQDSLSKSDLTSRLEQTNERMKKLSTTLASSVVSREEDELADDEEKVVVSARDTNSAHPLTRTTRIKVMGDPLDGMIESMIQTPDTTAQPSSEQLPSSMTDSDSHVYRAVVVQHHDEGVINSANSGTLFRG